MTDFIPGNIKRRHFEAHSFALDGSLNKPLKLQKGQNYHKNCQYRLSAVFQAMCYQHLLSQFLPLFFTVQNNHTKTHTCLEPHEGQ